MPRKQPHHEEEGGGESVGLWYVSFADMITLLLSFFVMLATFSSFSKDRLVQLNGVFEYVNNYSIFPGRNITQDSVIQQDREVDRSSRGSEKPTADSELSPIKNPRDSRGAASVAAYQDLRTLRIPSSRLFWAEGSLLTPDGKQRLNMIAAYLKLLPGQVVVAENSPQGRASPDRAMARAWAVAEYCQAGSGLPREQFGVAQGGPDDKGGPSGEPAIEITMMARSPMP